MVNSNFTYLYMFLYTVFIEGILKNLVVFNKFVIELCTPFEFRHIEGSGVDGVHYLAVYSSGSALLNLGQLQLIDEKQWSTH